MKVTGDDDPRRRTCAPTHAVRGRRQAWSGCCRRSAQPTAQSWPASPLRALQSLRPLRSLRLFCVAAAVWLGAACAALPAPPAPPAADANSAVAIVHLVGQGGHTGIVIAMSDLPPSWPGRADFAGATALEFGWGDAAYYTAAEPSIWLGIRAIAWPTPSVLHVAALRGEVTSAFPASPVVRLRLSAPGLARLLEFIGHEYALDANGQPVVAAPGQHGGGRFYRARSAFHFPRTCNWWAASALAAGGVPVDPSTTITAGELLAAAARHGEVLQPR
jgi:uncharacterized protein (TIGR02117 family)